MLERLWEGWKRLLHAIGAFQGRLLLSLFYFLVVMPYAVVSRLTSAPLQLRRPRDDSNWVPRQERPADLADARKQY